MNFKNLYVTLLTLSFVAFSNAASDTTSSIRGVITGPDGNPVANATVSVVHEPSGSKVSKSTNAQGVFIANNLRVGGPYKLTVTSAYGSQSLTDIYTKLAETFSANLVLEEAENVVTVGTKTNFNETYKTGARSNLSSDDLASISSITRGLKDAVATVPFVNVYSLSFEDDDQEGFTIAGQNPRYSTFSVDGVAQNDDFGLEKQGYPTIQSPISLDALDQVTVTVTDYDVRYSGTSAGNINAVTKSGTNEFKGTVFGYMQDDSLRGDSVEGFKPSTGEYEEETIGFTFGGPIIKDKLFFFLNVDDFEKTQPGEFGAAGSGAVREVQNVSIAQAQEVIDISRDVYNYDAGGYSGLASTLIDEDRLGKLDWNINDNHRATYTYQKSTNNISSEYGSSDNILSLTSGGFLKTTSLEVDTVQLFSDWSDTFSTSLKVSEKSTRQRNDNVGGNEFMRAIVLLEQDAGEWDDGGAQILVGPDPFRHANSLSTGTRNIELEFNKLIGIHEIVGGYSQKQVDTFNEFIAYSDVEQVYGGIDAYENKTPLSIDYRNAPSGNAIDGAAVYQIENYAFYIQDSMYFPGFADLGDLTFIVGLRHEGVDMPNAPRENPELIKAHGFSNSQSLNGKTNWLPRASFILEMDEDLGVFKSPTLRGGIGMFAGARPMVWISGTYSNDGIGIQNANVPLSAAALFDGNDESVYNQYIYQVGSSNYRPAYADVLDRNFDLPKDQKISLGMDWTFGNDYFMSADLILQSVKKDIHWEAMRHGNPYFSGTASPWSASWTSDTCPATAVTNSPQGQFPDGRDAYILNYDTCGKEQLQDFFDDMGYDVYITNTNKGDSKLLALSMLKEFENGWDVRANYTYSDVTTVGGQTSSRNISNFKYTPKYADFNEDIAVRSAFAREHSASVVASYDAYHFAGLKTSYTFVLNYSSGEPFAYTHGNYKDCGFWGLDTESCRDATAALYVPANPATTYADGVDMVVDSRYYDDFLSYLDQTGLSAYAGGFAPINEFEGPSNTQLDFKFTQELPGLGLTDGDKFILSLDVQNILNLLNDEWGVIKKGNDSARSMIEVEPRQADDGTLYYYGKKPWGISDSNIFNERTSYYRSLYKIQLGFRYHF